MANVKGVQHVGSNCHFHDGGPDPYPENRDAQTAGSLVVGEQEVRYRNGQSLRLACFIRHVAELLIGSWPASRR
jgi:hypothetical protein